MPSQDMMRRLQMQAANGDPAAIQMLREMQSGMVNPQGQQTGERWGRVLDTFIPNFAPQRAQPGDTGLMSPLQNRQLATAPGPADQTVQAPAGLGTPGAVQTAAKGDLASSGVQNLFGDSVYADDNAPVGINEGNHVLNDPIRGDTNGAAAPNLGNLLDQQDRANRIANRPITDIVPGRKPENPAFPSSIDDQADLFGPGGGYGAAPSGFGAALQEAPSSIDDAADLFGPATAGAEGGAAAGGMGGIAGMMQGLGAFLKTDEGKQLSRAMVDFGSGTMAASGQKGATTASSLGRGVQQASAGYDKRKDRADDVKYRDDTLAETKRYREGALELGRDTLTQRGEIADRTLDLTSRGLDRQQATLDQQIAFQNRQLDLMERQRGTAQFSAEAAAANAREVTRLRGEEISIGRSRLDIDQKRAETGDDNARRALFAGIGTQVGKELKLEQDEYKLRVENGETGLKLPDFAQRKADLTWDTHKQYGTLGTYLKSEGYDKASFETELKGQIEQINNTTEVPGMKKGKPVMVPFTDAEKKVLVDKLRTRLRQGMAVFD